MLSDCHLLERKCNIINRMFTNRALPRAFEGKKISPSGVAPEGLLNDIYLISAFPDALDAFQKQRVFGVGGDEEAVSR